jgi:hypothetical protein
MSDKRGKIRAALEVVVGYRCPTCRVLLDGADDPRAVRVRECTRESCSGEPFISDDRDCPYCESSFTSWSDDLVGCAKCEAITKREVGVECGNPRCPVEGWHLRPESTLQSAYEMRDEMVGDKPYSPDGYDGADAAHAAVVQASPEGRAYRRAHAAYWKREAGFREKRARLWKRDVVQRDQATIKAATACRGGQR